MKKNNLTTFIVITGFIILVLFIYIAVVNLNGNEESIFYSSKTESNMEAKPEYVDIVNNQLIIKTTGGKAYYCIKTTKSEPSVNSLCFNELENNFASVYVLPYKTYYVWIKDSNNVLSEPIKVNSKETANNE